MNIKQVFKIIEEERYTDEEFLTNPHMYHVVVVTDMVGIEIVSKLLDREYGPAHRNFIRDLSADSSPDQDDHFPTQENTTEESPKTKGDMDYLTFNLGPNGMVSVVASKSYYEDLPKGVYLSKLKTTSPHTLLEKSTKAFEDLIISAEKTVPVLPMIKDKLKEFLEEYDCKICTTYNGGVILDRKRSGESLNLIKGHPVSTEVKTNTEWNLVH